jgi:hypothetical protein
MRKLTDREIRQQAFIRVCRDSGFSLEASRAANIAAKVVGRHPLDIWTAFSGLDVMDRIASGDYPADALEPPHEA